MTSPAAIYDTMRPCRRSPGLPTLPSHPPCRPPMISIFPHETFGSLLDAVARIRPSTAEGPVPHPVVIPSLQFSDHLQRCLADRSGICMGFDFVMPSTFVHRVMHFRETRADSAWSKRRLVWRILPFVPEFEHTLGLEAANPRDRLALAGQVADRFDQYGHFRPDMIRRWAAGQAAPGDPATEEWQRALWTKLRQTTDEPHPAELMEGAKADTDFLRELARRHPRVHVLGTGALDPLLVEVLGLMDTAGCTVEAHVILPTLGFLGDLRRQGALPVPDTAPEELEAAGAHPLLPVMGRHAVGSFLLLGRLDENYHRWPVDTGPTAAGQGPVLHRLQADIRALRAPRPSAPAPDDGSIRIHACYGPRREMETVRDEILRALREIDGLQPGDIHIVSTSLDDYRPFISAVLQQGGRAQAAGLPVRMTETTPADGNPVIEALLALLGVASRERFSASELIELLQLRGVQSALEIEDGSPAADRLRTWIEESGLTHGLGDHAAAGTWTHARDRLVAGRWLDRDPSARYPDGSFVLALADDLGGASELRSRFVAWHALLEQSLTTWREPATPREWSERLLAASTALLGGDGTTMLEVQPHLEFLAEVDCAERLGAAAVLDWLSGDAGGGGRRTSPWGGILCGRIKQLQNLPCRVLIMTGLQDGAFPARGGEPPWDLLRHDPKAWDRNPRVDDRQQFLDALLTPTDRLVITASTLNPRSLKEAPFSSCVDELLRVLGAMGATREQLVVRHPLQPFSTVYFTGDAKIPRSFDSAGADVAKTLRQAPRREGLPFWSGRARPSDEMDEAEELDAESLTRFWKDPASAFVNACEVRLPHASTDDEDLDRLPLEPNSLQRWNLKEAVVRELLSDSPDLDRLRAEATGRRLLPSGALGEKLWRRISDEVGALGSAIRAGLGETLTIETAAGSPAARITARLGLTKDASHLLVWRTGNLKTPDQFLGPWIQAVIAAAAGESLPSRIIMEDGSSVVKDAIPREEAADMLEDLLTGFRRGQREPLCYAPRLSHEYLKLAAKGSPHTESTLAEAAAKCGWTGDIPPYMKTDRPKPPALLAWRDRDPLADVDSWRRWMERIARPLAAWGDF